MTLSLPSSALSVSQKQSKVVGLGQLVIADAGTELVTYGLGSCIGLALWSSSRQMGALCHIVLPSSRGRPFDPANAAKYVDWAVPQALRAFARRGIRKGDLVAKLAGGARTLGALSSDIGNQNAEATLGALHDEGIRVVAKSLGGTVGRTIRFHPDTGRIDVRLVGGAHSTL